MESNTQYLRKFIFPKFLKLMVIIRSKIRMCGMNIHTCNRPGSNLSTSDEVRASRPASSKVSKVIF